MNFEQDHDEAGAYSADRPEEATSAGSPAPDATPNPEGESNSNPETDITEAESITDMLRRRGLSEAQVNEFNTMSAKLEADLVVGSLVVAYWLMSDHSSEASAIDLREVEA